MILKRIDNILNDENYKDSFFDEDYTHGMVETFDFILYQLSDKFGYSFDEGKYIIGVYYETFKDNNEISSPDEIIIPEKSKYEADYNTYVRGNISGKMKSGFAYSPQQAVWSIKNYNWIDKTIGNDETEWDEFDVDFPYKIK